MAVGVRQNQRLYKLNHRLVVVDNEYAPIQAITAESMELWHERMGHAHYQAMEEGLRKGSIEGIKVDGAMVRQNRFCEACVLGNVARLPLPASYKLADKCGDLIHFDTCGPMSVDSPGKCRWPAVFVDDHSGFLLVYPMRKKDDIYEVVQSVLVEVAAAGHKLRAVGSDNAAEYKSSKIVSILNKHLVKHEFSTPYVAAQNGRVERQNRTVMETARTLLESAGLPRLLWAETVKAAGYIRNRVPIKRLIWRTPYEL